MRSDLRRIVCQPLYSEARQVGVIDASFFFLSFRTYVFSDEENPLYTTSLNIERVLTKTKVLERGDARRRVSRATGSEIQKD